MRPFHDPAILPTPVIAISACLAGELVRYDGDHKLQPVLLQTLALRVRWLNVCPEVAAGLGIPRPPIQLRRHTAGIAVVEVDDPTRDHSIALQQGAESLLQLLGKQRPSAIVLKARSPSCGTGTTSLFDDSGAAIALTDGIFAQACRAHFPDIPLLDEEALLTEAACQAFALLLLIRTDIEHGGPASRRALDAHYALAGIDTRLADAQHLQSQLAHWPERRIAEAFNSMWSGS